MYTIGPDFSAIAVNPAGIGGYWKGEFVGSLGLSATSYTARLDQDSTLALYRGESYTKVRLPNLGFVVVTQPRNTNWLTSNWAIGINRVADYDKEIQFSGHTIGSITDMWRENATGLDTFELNGFEEGLAWRAGAIYDFERDLNWETDYQLSPQSPIYKEETASISGGKSELFLGYGANMSQKLMIGFSVNLPLVNAESYRTYIERDDIDGTPFFNDLEYTSTINTSGYGLNGKFGIIAKPSKAVNISFAAHTPTKFFLTDNYNTTITYDYTDGNHNGPITSESPFGSFQYALKTPWKLVGGVGIIVGKSGFVSAGAQWTDYSSMKYDYSVRGNGNEYNQLEREVNSSIKSNYGPALQLNLGGELAINTIRARAGTILSQSAFNNDNSFDPSFHAGLGYRGEYFFLDLGYAFSKQDEGYLPYETKDAPQPLAVLDYTTHKIVATVGLKF